MTAETITKRKLSELIREGAKLRPQGYSKYFSHDAGETCSCAWGAAIEAYFPEATTHDDEPLLVSLVQAVCGIEDVKVTLPETDKARPIFSAIVMLNDKFKWTREQIADWLEAEGY